MVGGRVANAIAAGLDRVHLHFGQLGQDGGHVFELGPIELHVLACAEMTVATIPGAGDMGQRAQLPRG